jgi:cytochrome P450
MLSSDPPDHTRLRRLVSAGFTARRIERLEPRITEIAEHLLDQMAGSVEVDLIDRYAFALPVQVIGELLGVPHEDRDAFRGWSTAIVEGSLSNDQARTQRMQTSLRDLAAYIRGLLARIRQSPADDLLSALLAVRDSGDRLTEDELVSMVFLMLVAGHETTMNLIGTGVFLLLTHPDQRRRLDEDPSLLPNAIEEFLRYESPVQTSTYRVTTEAVELAGVEIPAREPVLISLLSANRDGRRFDDPHRLDLARQDVGHLAFGHGIHFCLGAALARLEGRIAIEALLRRYPDLHLRVAVADLDWRPGLLVRGLSSLPVGLRARETTAV